MTFFFKNFYTISLDCYLILIFTAIFPRLIIPSDEDTQNLNVALRT
jgi:hypothetical protein